MGKFTEGDRERVLMRIATATTTSIYNQVTDISPSVQVVTRFGVTTPQFLPGYICEAMGMPIAHGDIVKCVTNPNHRWAISELVQIRGDSDFLLKEIGGEKTCDMRNEALHALRFMPPEDLLTGKKRKVYLWAEMAFSSRYNPEYCNWGSPRFHSAHFAEDGVWIFGGPSFDDRLARREGHYPQPRKYFIRWKNCKRLRDMIACINHQGLNSQVEFSGTKPEYPVYCYSIEELRSIARKVNYAG